jgi:hypothetical protein
MNDPYFTHQYAHIYIIAPVSAISLETHTENEYYQQHFFQILEFQPFQLGANET